MRITKRKVEQIALKHCTKTNTFNLKFLFVTIDDADHHIINDRTSGAEHSAGVSTTVRRRYTNLAISEFDVDRTVESFF